MKKNIQGHMYPYIFWLYLQLKKGEQNKGFDRKVKYNPIR